MRTRIIIEQFDPVRPKPGGIDTCIRGLVAYAPEGERLRIVGVDAIGDKRLGEWATYEIGGRSVDFMPVTKLDHADLRRVIPHSVRLAAGLRRYLPKIDADVVQTHRVNMGVVALRRYPDSEHVQLIHSSGVQNLGKGSRSRFRWLKGRYRGLERRVVSGSRAVVVFSRSGAERLAEIAPIVHFSPTWFDPKEFIPSERDVVSRRRILWACRIEPAKNPVLAIETMHRLPDDFELTVAGDGTLMSEMRARVAALGLGGRVRFVGAIPKGSVGELMREHELLMMSSRFEGFSRAVVEALATDLPVATTPGGEPNGLIIEGVNGGRADSDEPDALASAVRRAAAIPSGPARASVEELNAAVIVPRILGY